MNHRPRPSPPRPPRPRSLPGAAALTAACASLALAPCGRAAPLAVTATNRLPLARPAQTLELTAAQLAAAGEGDLTKLHVLDEDGRELLCQALDADFDAYRKPDLLIFQADFAPGQARTFRVKPGPKQVHTREEFKAFGRFVRERFDDFAWENDRIAHRTYGQALETWAGEPLTSSTVDIWSKRTARMVINDWYLADHYHDDTGEGADFYSAGPSRGCGGNGLWAAGRLWTSRNFVRSRVLASGPVRVLFELDYDAFDVDGTPVRETKRIALDGGCQLGRFQSTYHVEKPGERVCGIGIKKVAGVDARFSPERGSLVVWEPMAKRAGMQGIAVVAAPGSAVQAAEDPLNHLLLVPCGAGDTVAYWAGFCWDRAGVLTSAETWDQYVAEFARGLASPIELSVSSAP